MAKIAFLGTGNMGFGMAERLIAAGHQLHIYNRTASKTAPLVRQGAILASSPREASENVDVIFAMVGDDTASDIIWNGDGGVLSGPVKAGTLAIECSTLSHDWVKVLSKSLQRHGFDYLDCPVTGLPTAAAAGELTLLIGGASETLAKAQPYLDPLSVKQYHFGGIGSGTAYKLIVNLMGSVQIVALAEGLLAAEKAGLDLEIVSDALRSGACGSPQVDINSPPMTHGDHDTNVLFSALWRLKDTDYGVKFSEKMGTSNGLALESLKQFQKLVDAGFETSAGSKVIDVMRKN